MVSEFRKKKLLRGFQFMDTDKNGTINKIDFDLVLEKISKARGWVVGDAKYNETQETMNKIWEGMQKEGDVNNDGEITTDEWIALWDSYSKNSAPMEFQNLYCKFMFSLQDLGNDGKIDSEDFITVITASGRSSKEDAETAFRKISKGKSFVSFEDFQELWKEYHVTEDPDAPGNYIFGRTVA